MPARLRRPLYDELSLRLAPPRDRSAPRAPAAPWIIAGCPSAATGLGQAARLAALALRERGEEVRVIDLSRALLQKPVHDMSDFAEGGTGPGTLLLFLNPPAAADALRLIGPARLAGKRRIGCWVWELPVAPASWTRHAALFDELAAPSRFACEAIARSTGRAVRQLCHPVAVESFPPRPRRGCDAPLRFGFAVDLGSTEARKNTGAVIRAFREAFGSGQDARLGIKLRDRGAHEQDRRAFRDAVASLGAQVDVVSGDLGRAELMDWMRGLDVYVSLHRSEGFGLSVAEAMAMGIPVVSTDWSATAEFVDRDVGFPVPADTVPARDPTGRYALAGAVWADIRLDRAVDALRTAHRQRARLPELGRQAQARVASLFSADVFLRQLTS